MENKARVIPQLIRVCLMLFCIASVAAHAEAETIKSQVSKALVENRDLQAARINLQKAEARLRQAGLFPNPELQLFRSSDRAFNNEGEFQASAGFVQKFPVSGRISKAQNIARVDVALALAEIRDQERLLVNEVSGTARKLLILDESIKVNEQLQKSIKELIQVSEKRLRVAEVSVADINLEKLELQKLLFNHVSLTSERSQTNELLNRLVGQSAGIANKIVEPITIAPDLSTKALAKLTAVERRPDRQFAALSINKAASEVILAKAERWEDWAIGIEYSQELSKFDSSLISTGRDDFIGLSVSIPLPFWNRNEGNISEAEASRSQAIKALEALELKIQTESEAAYVQLVQLSTGLTNFQSKSQKLAQENVRLLRESYAQGLVGISAVIQAQQQLAETQQTFLSLVGDYYSALTAFETITASSPFWENSL